MHENEIIFLSSDEEEKEKLLGSNYLSQLKGNSLVPILNVISNSSKAKYKKVLKKKNEKSDSQQKKNLYKIIPTEQKKNLSVVEKEVVNIDDDCIEIQNIKSPEIVDLEEIEGEKKSDLYLEKEKFDGTSAENFKNTELKKNVISQDSTLNLNQPPENHKTTNLNSLKKCKTKIVTSAANNSSLIAKNKENEIHFQFPTDISLSGKSDSSTLFYDEFVNLCVSLEPNANDKNRLQKKLQKRFNEASPQYVKGEEFKNLIEKSKIKINGSNLYLVAKEICDELCSKKVLLALQETKTQSNEINIIFDKNHDNDNKVESNLNKLNKKKKKQEKIIKKIIKQLDLLGTKIHELEEAEVDLSDEEDSSYLQLQRYRYKFCSIYKKLCKYTNQVSDANRIYSRKIYFSGSKYPKINQCIEKWLNETKRFPDFTDIMKLLENQSTSLGLGSDQQSIREIAIEIFQRVGIMLQQRRKYDLWDSFCGYLDESEDPAINNPELNNILRKNFENRILKEKEIIEHYAEMQEKKRLKPEEIPEEDAFNSPSESGNEDENEIEEIEELINKKLDNAIEKENLFENANNNDTESKAGLKTCDNRNSAEKIDCIENIEVQKESKNNFKNCKSIKWREKTYEDADDHGSKLTKSSEKTETPQKIENDNKRNIIIIHNTKKENDNERDTVIINNTKEENKKKVKVSKMKSSHSSTEISISMKLPNIQPQRFSQPANPTVKSKEITELPIKRQKLSLPENKNFKYSNDSEKGPKLDLYFEVRFVHVQQNFKNFCKIDYIKNLSEKTKKRKPFKNIVNNKPFFIANCHLKDRKYFLTRMLRNECTKNKKKYYRKKNVHLNFKLVGAKSNFWNHKTKQKSKILRNNSKKHYYFINGQTTNELIFKESGYKNLRQKNKLKNLRVEKNVKDRKKEKKNDEDQEER